MALLITKFPAFVSLYPYLIAHSLLNFVCFFAFCLFFFIYSFKATLLQATWLRIILHIVNKELKSKRSSSNQICVIFSGNRVSLSGQRGRSVVINNHSKRAHRLSMVRDTFYSYTPFCACKVKLRSDSYTEPSPECLSENAEEQHEEFQPGQLKFGSFWEIGFSRIRGEIL